MTDLRKAAEMALEYLEYLNELDIVGLDHEIQSEALRQALALSDNPLDIADRAYFAGKQAGIEETLAQPEQEPVAWEKNYDIACSLLRQAHDILATTQYPIKRPWVSLTDEEIDYIWGVTPPDYENFFEFPRALEAKLKEKNT